MKVHLSFVCFFNPLHMPSKVTMAQMIGWIRNVLNIQIPRGRGGYFVGCCCFKGDKFCQGNVATKIRNSNKTNLKPEVGRNLLCSWEGYWESRQQHYIVGK